jgi:Putative type VII ESX secretion system translocon, EccE
MPSDAPRYTFNPLERRGVVAGFQASQVAVLSAGCLVAVVVIREAPSLAGLIGAVAVVAAAAAGACWTVAGRSVGAWVPVRATWLWRRLTRSRTSPQPTAGHLSKWAAEVPLSAEGRRSTVGRPAPDCPRSADGRPPPSLAGLRLQTAAAVPGAAPMAVINDRRAGTYAAVLSVRGRSFSLLDPNEKRQRLAGWGAALAAMAREGSPVHRLQWIERTLPGDSDGLLRYFEAAAAADAAGRESYARLVAGAGPATHDHEVLLVLAVHSRRVARTRRAFGPASEGSHGLLRREIRLLQGQLRSADLIVDRVLAEAELAGALRVAVDPDARSRSSRLAIRPWGAWPVAADERWSTYRTDGAWHVTYWVAEWPRVDVGPDFLAPLLLGAGGRRAAAVTMAPVRPAQAARQVEAARTADMADEELRRRAGFVSTARRRREAEGVLRREAELADGHAEYRFSGYVTVSALDRAALDTSCAEVEQAASQAHLELRRLYGQQEEAFTWTLPLARGLT